MIETNSNLPVLLRRGAQVAVLVLLAGLVLFCINGFSSQSNRGDAPVQDVQTSVLRQDLAAHGASRGNVDRATVVEGAAEYTDAITLIEEIPFEVIEQNDASMFAGQTRIKTAGVTGQRQVTYLVTTQDGQETERELIADVLLVEAVNQVTLIGTMSVPAAPAVSAGTAQEIAKRMVADRGWSDVEYDCLYQLWKKESNWRVNAHNKSSGAYGIPQSLPGNKMASVADDWMTNPETQITWGLKYIANRYDTPCGAWGHSQVRNWY